MQKQKQRQKPYSCSLCCSCSLPPLALRRSLAHGRHTDKGGIGCGGMGIGIGTTCFGDIGRSGFAVGYLPATATASGLAKKPARLPYSSPNAKNTSKSCTPKTVGWRHCSTWTKQHKRQAQAKPCTESDRRSPNCRGAPVTLAVQLGRFSRIHRSLPKTVVTDEVFIL